MTEHDSSGADRCIRCGSLLVPVAYGYPGTDLLDAAERGEVVLGGCLRPSASVDRQCPLCSKDDQLEDPPLGRTVAESYALRGRRRDPRR